MVAKNATISASGTGMTAAGSFTGLAPGASDGTDLTVGLNTTNPGTKTFVQLVR